MAHKVTVIVWDGKQNTPKESHVIYRVDIPSDILFLDKNGVRYAQWWTAPNQLMSIPVFQILAID